MSPPADPKTIVKMLAAGHPVWYVAAVTKTRAHDVHEIGTAYGYPDRTRLRHSLAHRGTRSPAA
ncbi:MAG TPA: hypothetical protein VGJ44_20995 [Kribbellaceae bacterium]